MRPPSLSAYDPLVSGEGSIDPLGLAVVYERLADRMLPGVTVRMGRPRFVTAIAIGAYLSQQWPRDFVASDGVTPPWLAFEWFVVEAFVREKDLLEPGPGIPGVMKAQRALNNGRPLNALSYLKTPTVFGFTGIFRRLARALRVTTADGRLDDAGYELLSAWANEQRMDGFVDGSSGAGAAFREQLLRAVAQAMERGSTTYQSGEFWKTLVRALDPAKAGAKERVLIHTLLRSRAGPPHMVSTICDALIARRSTIEMLEEGDFLRLLAKSADPEYRTLLTGIEAYERLCGLLTDAFDRIRFLGGKSHGAPIGLNEYFADDVDKLVTDLPDTVSAIESHKALLEWEPEVLVLLDRFRTVGDVQSLYTALLSHHELVQTEKPPNGKRAWFERERGDRILVRPDYILDEAPTSRVAQVHEYRIPTFSRFLADLGAFA